MVVVEQVAPDRLALQENNRVQPSERNGKQVCRIDLKTKNFLLTLNAFSFHFQRVSVPLKHN